MLNADVSAQLSHDQPLSCTHAHTCSRARARAHTRTHAHTHTHTHTHTRTHAHTHTHTHTHTHSCDALACGITASNVTVVGINSDGTVAGSHTLLSAGSATEMQLMVDTPSPTTGTGSAMYLDGQDVAFVRAQLVDAAGACICMGARVWCV
jgi:hypothetical protein